MTLRDSLDLTRRLQEELSHDVYFAQTLVEYGTQEDVAQLESLLHLCQRMRLEPMDDPDWIERHRLIKEIDRRTHRKTKGQIRKTFRITRTVRV